jgi:hypothetical protein
MKKTIVIFIGVLFIQSGFTRATNTSKNILDFISLKVIYYLQNKQADSIYSITGQNFRNHITKDDFKSISENQIFPINNFQNVTYVKTLNEINKYKVAGSPELQLLIGIDKENKIETLLIQPYSEN